MWRPRCRSRPRLSPHSDEDRTFDGLTTPHRKGRRGNHPKWTRAAAHWFFVLLVYFWVCHAFGGTLGTISLGDAMLVLAFTLAGSALQLPGVGGGAQVASFLALTAVLGVEKEPAAAAAIVLWLISFAACSLAGVPLLLREGFSPGKLRAIAQHEKQEVGS